MGHVGELELLVMLAINRLTGEAYGVTILDEIERKTSRSITLGTVYKTLMRLEAKSYLTTRTAPPTAKRGGRRKKMYELSPSGLVALRRSFADVKSLAQGLDLETEES